MHQLLKNLVFVVAANAAFIGTPFGVTKLVSQDFLLGGVSASVSVLILATSLWVAVNYHNHNVDVTGLGYFGGLLTVIGGSSAMLAYGFVDTIVFSKFLIIAIALFLHTLIDAKNAFWMQKAALAVALLSVAFFSTLPLLGAGAGTTLLLFIISIVLHAKGKNQESREQGGIK